MGSPSCDRTGGHFEQADENGLYSPAMAEFACRTLKQSNRIGEDEYWDLIQEMAGQMRVLELPVNLLRPSESTWASAHRIVPKNQKKGHGPEQEKSTNF